MIYDKLTPVEYLDFVAGLWGVDAGVAEARAHELLDWLDLGDHAHERCEGFSKGMRQKVALAGALVHDPRVIILDEPLTGLDAASARQVKAVLRERVAAGDTVIMTTHILEVAERMADRIGIIAGGRLIAEGTLEELRGQAGTADHDARGHVPVARRGPGSGMSHPGTLAWFAQHEVPARLARLGRDDDGRPPPAHDHRGHRADRLRVADASARLSDRQALRGDRTGRRQGHAGAS